MKKEVRKVLKRYGNMLIVALAAVVAIALIVRYNASVRSHRSAVICGSFSDAPCYLYTCATGDVEMAIGGNASCSDGSEVIRGNEVPRVADE